MRERTNIRTAKQKCEKIIWCWRNFKQMRGCVVQKSCHTFASAVFLEEVKNGTFLPSTWKNSLFFTTWNYSCFSHTVKTSCWWHLILGSVRLAAVWIGWIFCSPLSLSLDNFQFWDNLQFLHFRLEQLFNYSISINTLLESTSNCSTFTPLIWDIQ